jgi:hypothetical protein
MSRLTFPSAGVPQPPRPWVRIGILRLEAIDFRNNQAIPMQAGKLSFLQWTSLNDRVKLLQWRVGWHLIELVLVERGCSEFQIIWHLRMLWCDYCLCVWSTDFTTLRVLHWIQFYSGKSVNSNSTIPLKDSCYDYFYLKKVLDTNQ